MNHPTIATSNAQARYNEMLQEAAAFRREKQIKRHRGVIRLITAVLDLFI